jgi:hypothetical protein
LLRRDRGRPGGAGEHGRRQEREQSQKRRVPLRRPDQNPPFGTMADGCWGTSAVTSTAP